VLDNDADNDNVGSVLVEPFSLAAGMQSSTVAYTLLTEERTIDTR
jgi:hypothetical protein